ncbi:MAPEG family protein [Zhongshania sp. BJYM1]|uniref:MAPEG family protein n=1 Tax=Zhongshania aquatica TaxID=2965069 RepID=UPI0022B5284B|nr:MAPEG family protein [Marortus sp. BJYM1]
MSIAFWCIFAAGMMPGVTSLFAKLGKTDIGHFDNNHPREWLARVGGWRARAVAASQNGFEGFPLYAAAVIIAQFGGAEQGNVNMLALAYIGVRIVFTICYLQNWATLRSLVWVAGIGVILTLFCITPAIAI